MLIGYFGLGGSQLNTLLGTGIHVPDHFTVRRGQLIEFVDPVLDALHMPPYVLLAGKWVQDEPCQAGLIAVPDRKSTRLNSSHLGISYAVFCLKKKKDLHARVASTLVARMATASSRPHMHT